MPGTPYPVRLFGKKDFSSANENAAKKARQALEGWAKAHSGGSAQRDQRNGAEGRNPASATQRALAVLLGRLCFAGESAAQKN